MTVRTTERGGTDWSDGATLTAADLNDTFNQVGRLEKISHQTLSGAATANFTGLSTYRYFVVVMNIQSDSTNVELWLRLNGITTSRYNFIAGTTTGHGNYSTQSKFVLCGAAASQVAKATGKLTIGKDLLGSNISVCVAGPIAPYLMAQEFFIVGEWSANSGSGENVDEINLLASSGNITGYVTLYGVRS